MDNCRFISKFFQLNNQDIETFLESLINHQLFKILPLKEEGNDSLKDYLDSLLMEVIGAKFVFKELNESMEYVRIINTLEFLANNDFTIQQCRREVFKMINLTKKILCDVKTEGE